MGLTSFRGQHRRWVGCQPWPGPLLRRGWMRLTTPRVRGATQFRRPYQPACGCGRKDWTRKDSPPARTERACDAGSDQSLRPGFDPSGLTTFHARIGRRTPVRGLSFGRCTIPPEAQRLGITASTSDLNPVAEVRQTCRLSSPMRAPRAVGPSRAACLHGSRPTPGAAPPAPPHRVPTGFLRGAADCGILIVAGPSHPRSQPVMVQPTRENDQRGAYAWTRRSS